MRIYFQPHLTELVRLIGHVGLPLPEAQKFVYWATEFSDDIRYAIQRTAAKNLRMNGTMPILYRERYCTSVMRGTAARRQVRP